MSFCTTKDERKMSNVIDRSHKVTHTSFMILVGEASQGKASYKHIESLPRKEDQPRLMCDLQS